MSYIKRDIWNALKAAGADQSIRHSVSTSLQSVIDVSKYIPEKEFDKLVKLCGDLMGIGWKNREAEWAEAEKEAEEAEKKSSSLDGLEHYSEMV